MLENFLRFTRHIDVARGGNLRAKWIPNTDTGTMDIKHQVDEGQKSFVEKIEIRGNTKTKDKVIRRELAFMPGEVFDMTRVKISQRRLQGWNISPRWTPGPRIRKSRIARTCWSGSRNSARAR